MLSRPFIANISGTFALNRRPCCQLFDDTNSYAVNKTSWQQLKITQVIF